jgi:hypothetical protein
MTAVGCFLFTIGLMLSYRIAVRHRNRPPMLRADLQQAHYFHTLLGDERAELEEQLDQLHTELLTLDRIGDEHGVRTKRRIIKALESEARSIDRMRKALSARLAERDRD